MRIVLDIKSSSQQGKSSTAQKRNNKINQQSTFLYFFFSQLNNKPLSQWELCTRNKKGNNRFWDWHGNLSVIVFTMWKQPLYILNWFNCICFSSLEGHMKQNGVDGNRTAGPLAGEWPAPPPEPQPPQTLHSRVDSCHREGPLEPKGMVELLKRVSWLKSKFTVKILLFTLYM